MRATIGTPRLDGARDAEGAGKGWRKGSERVKYQPDLPVIIAGIISWGELLLPTSAPLPFNGYPFLMMTLASWISESCVTARPDLLQACRRIGTACS